MAPESSGAFFADIFAKGKAVRKNFRKSFDIDRN
jgi:hypothetical protein